MELSLAKIQDSMVRNSLLMYRTAKDAKDDGDHLYSSPLATLSFILARLRNQSLEKSLPCVSARAIPAPYTAKFRNNSP